MRARFAEGVGAASLVEPPSSFSSPRSLDATRVLGAILGAVAVPTLSLLLFVGSALTWPILSARPLSELGTPRVPALRDPTVCRPAVFDAICCVRRRRDDSPAAEIGLRFGPDVGACCEPDSRSSSCNAPIPRREPRTGPGIRSAATGAGALRCSPVRLCGAGASSVRCWVPGLLDGDAERRRCTADPKASRFGSRPARLKLDALFLGVGDGDRFRARPA